MSDHPPTDTSPTAGRPDGPDGSHGPEEPGPSERPDHTIRCPEDALALVPLILGFEPERSVVMLTFGGRHGFHGRVDLPPPDGVERCVQQLLLPARHHRVGSVLFVLYGEDRAVRPVARPLRRGFVGAGIAVHDVIRACEGRWYAPLRRHGVPSHGVPYDVSDHPFRVRAVVEGRVVAASRRELADGLLADSAAVRAVEAALEDAAGADALDGAGLRDLLGRHLRAGTTPDDVEAARVLLAVLDPAVRDHAWYGMRRAESDAHVRLWTDLVRRAPAGLVAGAAGVLAFAAWTHGDGALAWCAVDRCLADRPGHSLGRLVAEALERAVPPVDGWSDRFPGGLAG